MIIICYSGCWQQPSQFTCNSILTKQQVSLLNIAIAVFIMLLKDCSLIRGLKYYPNFITPAQKQHLLTIVNSHSWCDRLLRRQQYYGIKYFQTTFADHVLQPTISHGHFSIQPFQFLIDKLIHQHHIFHHSNPPNQILVNRYLTHDRLGLHVEDRQAFGDVIVGISMGSVDYLRLVDAEDSRRRYLLELQDCSCYVLSDEARDRWRHGIGRVFEGSRFKSESFERISLTVRHVVQSRRRIQV